MSNKNKIQLILYKNKKKTKNNLAVNFDITYEKFEAKLKQFTGKMFEIQIQTKQKDSFIKLIPSNFKQCLQNYKGEKINIITFEDSLIASNKSTKNEHNDELDDIQFRSIQKQRNNQEVKSSLKKSLQKVQIIQDSKQKQNEGINKNQLSYNQFESMIQTKQEIKQRIKPIFQYYENISLQKIYEKNKHKQHQKRCCQCKNDIVAAYFVCLICPRPIIICSSCQQKDIIKAHNFKGHALAKIKRWTQQITSKTSIQTEGYQMNKLIQQKIQQIIKKKMQGKSKLREP